MRIKIESDRLEQIPEHYADEAWVNQYAEEIYWAMREMLKQRKLVGEVVSHLLLIYPILLGREDLRRWVKLATRAHRKVQRQALRRRPEPRYSPTQAYVIPPAAAQRAKPRKPRSQRLDQREMFEVYLNLMMSQACTQPGEMMHSTLNSALAFARKINDQYYYGKLYQTLAYVLLANAQFDKALDFGLLAYRYWEGRNDTIEEALTAFVIALSQRNLGDWQQTAEWLEKAADLFAKVDYPRSHGIVAMEYACTDIYLSDFAKAVQWAEIALRELQAEQMAYQVGLAYHVLGLAQAYYDQFDAAINNLWRAINYWESVGNLMEQIHTEHSLAFAEALSGQKERAMIRLSRNRELCARLPESRRKTYHLERVTRLEEAIKTGADLLRLFIRH